MSLIPSSATKHSLDGVGEAGAVATFAALAANPSTIFLTTGISGKIVFWILTKMFSGFASMGLVILNVGAEKILAVSAKIDFDGSFKSAQQFIEEVRKTGRELTPEEIKKIDDNVIEQLRKFGKIARKKDA